MKKLLIIVIFFIICFPVYSQDDVSKALMTNEPIYLLFGFPDDQVKLQLSFKYDVLYNARLGFYIAYNQLMFWDLYSLSSPFREIVFNPELFWEFRSGYNFMDNIELILLDYIRIAPYAHFSNGRMEPFSRGVETAYIQGQFGVGDTFRLGINLKYHFFTWRIEGANSDYLDYLGPLETKLFFYIKDKDEKQEELYIKAGFLGAHKTQFNVNFLEFGIMSRVLLSRFRPYLQLYYGYSESLLTYNEMSQNETLNLPFSLRVGVVLE